MAQAWHECISSELEEVEAVMDDVTRSDNPQLREMCQYVLANHGKRIRPAVTILSFYASGGREPKRAIDVGAAIELIHNATLIHDDINDQGEMRRGAKALYKQYSLGKSIVAGDYMFALGFHLIGSTSAAVVDYVIEAASSMGAGEFAQKRYERNVAVGEAQYMNIISGKTARLIECAAKCGAYLADAEEIEEVDRLGEFAFRVGQAFQIVDDVLDVTGYEDNTGKKTGNDILEGKPTLPTIYGIQDPRFGPRIEQIFENEHATAEDAAEAIELIRQTDAVPRCLEKARSLVEGAVELIAPLPDSEYKDALIGLARFIAVRDR